MTKTLPQTRTRLHGVLFDLDGTLVDSLAATFEAFNHGFETVGAPKLHPREIVKHFGPGELQIFEKLVGPAKAHTAFAAALEYTDRNLGRVPLHAGIAELLDSLREAHVPVAVVTGRGWESTEMILTHLHLLDRFVTIVANDHVPNPKPAPDGLHLALGRMKLKAENTLYVGDSWADIRAARSAGAEPVAALWDWNADRAHLEPHGPAHWAEHPRQILELWQARGKGEDR